jgi:hypothetical protein
MSNENLLTYATRYRTKPLSREEQNIEKTANHAESEKYWMKIH